MKIYSDTIYLNKALNSFEGYNGCIMPKDPTNEEEFLALQPSVEGRKVWQGTVPSWSDVVAKQAELKKADEDKQALKIAAYKKLGLTDDEIAAVMS